jgi:hypothetical protein
MRPYAIRFLTLTLYAAAVVTIPVVMASGREASGRHLRKHHYRIYPGWTNPGWNDPWIVRGVRPVVPSYPPGPVCPGNARGIDCKVWPPPMDEDPDRKQSGADSG